MQVHATGDFRQAIVVDADSLKSLWAHVYEFAGSCTAIAKCSDDISRTFDTLDLLLSYENSPASAVKTLELEGRRAEAGRSISITMGRPFSSPAEVSVRGEEEPAARVRSKVLETLAGMKAWYSAIATVDLFGMWLMILLFGFTLLVLMAPSKAPDHPARSLRAVMELLAQGSLYLLPLVLAIWASVRGRQRLFHKVSFAIGHGTRRYAIAEQVRWTVCIGFLVSIVASVVYEAVTK
ncbi:MAG: hypothetical protein ACTHL8_00985 [Burkholderiaceae bacterium]